MTTPDRNSSIGSRAVSRRTFLAGSAAAGAAAAVGLEGILSAGRAPAFAQGTRLNIVRWVDFIPACDVELKRQAVEASKALGAEVVFEFINANDLQARITAAMQSGAGPDIIQMLHNWPHLYANGLVDVSDLVAWQVKEQGALYPLSEANVKVGGKFLALPHGIVPGLIAYRKSWFDEIGVTTFPKTYEELRQVGAAVMNLTASTVVGQHGLGTRVPLPRGPPPPARRLRGILRDGPGAAPVGEAQAELIGRRDRGRRARLPEARVELAHAGAELVVDVGPRGSRREQERGRRQNEPAEHGPRIPQPAAGSRVLPGAGAAGIGEATGRPRSCRRRGRRTGGA
jgi:hypothetical protein